MVDKKFTVCTGRRCVIGEGPVWNAFERRLYFTNGYGGNEICRLDPYTRRVSVRPVSRGVAAMAFDIDNRLIVSRADGVFYLRPDDSAEALYDTAEHSILFGNDMKAGPDGRIYIGTQSGKRKGVSDKIDGKLYRIDKNGDVKVLLDGLILSNGLDWSPDEKRFYHTDSDTALIREYAFDRGSGEIEYTGRSAEVPGVDGFTVNTAGDILAACWGKKHIAVIDTEKFRVAGHIETPCAIPASCGFAGDAMEFLVITSAAFGADPETDKDAGFAVMMESEYRGRAPYLFGQAR